MGSISGQGTYKKQPISSQDEGVGKHTLSPCTTTAKITTRLQNKHHPDLSGNRAEWKSDNQGFKEDSIIQTGRRGGDMKRHREVQRGRGTGGPTFTCGG